MPQPFLFFTNRLDYTMQNTKENTPEINLNDYIKYLYKECISKTTDPNPEIYDQINQFVKTLEGQRSFEQFKSLNPEKIGIQKIIPTNHFKKVSQS